MKKSFFQFIAATFLCMIFSYEAKAECNSRGPFANFHGDTIEVNSETDNGACGYGFNFYKNMYFKYFILTF